MNQPANKVKQGIPGPAQPYSEYWNLIILVPETAASDKSELIDIAVEFELYELAEFLRDNSNLKPARVIQSRTTAEIRNLEKRARHGTNPPEHSLNTFWRMRFGNAQDKDITLGKLNAIAGDQFFVYTETLVGCPSDNVTNNEHQHRQNYLDEAPTGVDARWAWTQAGGKGEGVKLIDLEVAWRFSHEDLPTVELLHGSNKQGVGSETGAHGTHVLGVIAAPNNTTGIIGVAPALSSLKVVSHYKNGPGGPGDYHVEEAILEATLNLDAGDVLLLEVQRFEIGSPGALPTEVNLADYTAIRLAVSLGIVVVEAAANGDRDLSMWQDQFGKTLLDPNSDDRRDSGAILVGSAVHTVTGTPEGHERYYTSNHGNRVDCYAWGDRVVTTGAGSLGDSTNVDAQYTVNFSETSAASAIIAGVAAVTQAWCKDRYSAPLTPGQLRAVLSSPSFGTPQVNIAGEPIGVMPNLRKILSWRLTLCRIWWASRRRIGRITAIIGIRLHSD